MEFRDLNVTLNLDFYISDTCHCFDGPNVAFTAFLDKNVATFGAKQPLPFDNITLNSGNVYDPRHAAFTAPFDGVYQVFVTIATNAGYTLVVDILHNSTPITKLRTGNENQWHTATNGVIVHMRKGDDIWVEHSATGDSNRLYFGDGMITSFSGYLIHKDWLTLTIFWTNSAKDKLIRLYLPHFPQKIGFDTSLANCLLRLFSGEKIRRIDLFQNVDCWKFTRSAKL